MGKSATTTHPGKTITGTDAKMRYPVPPAHDFGGDEFKRAPDLKKIGDELVATHARLSNLRKVKIVYLWKYKGGGKRGQCVKASGLVSFWSKAAFIIWLNAEHAADNQMTCLQIEALLYHELRFADVDDNGKPCTRKTDFEGFADELAISGPHDFDLQKARQGLLDFGESLP